VELVVVVVVVEVVIRAVDEVVVFKERAYQN
jgi:hypothetical protein